MRGSGEAGSRDEGAPARPALVARRDLVEEVIALGLIALVIGAYAWDVRDIAQPAQNLMVMRPVLIGGAVLVLVVLARYVLWPLLTGRVRASEAASSQEDSAARGGQRWAMVLVSALLLAYVAVFPLLPFVLSTTLFMAASLYGLGARKPVFVVGIALVTALGLYFVGNMVLGVALPA